MCALYKNRYRIESSRLKGYDYSCNALYFITICTKDFFPYFGEVNSDNILVLKGPGEIARRFWLEIPNHFNCAKLDEYIIMPDHIHGIIKIRNTKNITGWPVETPKLGVSTNYPSGVVPGRDAQIGRLYTPPNIIIPRLLLFLHYLTLRPWHTHYNPAIMQ